MPIYAYRCDTCHHAQDILRKISDAPLTICTACGQDTFVKQVTSAGFALKGSGWYVTDFRGEGSGSKSSDGTATAPKTEAASGSSEPSAPAKTSDSGATTTSVPAPASSPAPSSAASSKPAALSAS